MDVVLANDNHTSQVVIFWNAHTLWSRVLSQGEAHHPLNISGHSLPLMAAAAAEFNKFAGAVDFPAGSDSSTVNIGPTPALT